jgi:hypothetical protein
MKCTAAEREKVITESAKGKPYCGYGFDFTLLNP